VVISGLLAGSLYAMVALDRESPTASEAAMKYFVLGAIASGILLYGMSLLYGATGTLDITGLGVHIAANPGSNLATLFALGFIVVGLCFKLGAVPFHMWVPDVYEGAPTSVTLFVGSAPEIASFALFMRLLVEGLGGLHMQWQPLLIAVSLLSMAIGAIVAIAQSNLKRMLAYSTIGHMDRGGVGTALLSVTIPGVWLGDVATSRKLARECNEYAMRLVSDHPGRFGMFPALPLPDADGSLAEIEYVLDVLKADGIGLLTSYGDKWLGDPAFDPVMAELNRRKTVVYTHPTVANCCRNLVQDVSPAIVEFGADTSRAIARLVFGGAAVRYPDIRWIFSHAGGAVPFLIERFLFQARTPQGAKQLPHGVMPELRKFYYDTAQAFDAPPMLALKKMVPTSQIVFGTDFPFRTAEEHVKGLRAAGVFSAQELRAIEHDNAQRLLPPRYRV
jgi:predicted TIM-barrel fold metal-dependent hydrolase